MTPAIIIGERCHYCSKFRSPLEIIHQPGGVKICLHCEQLHEEALQALSTGVFNGQCSECGLSAEELKAQKRCGPNGSMACHSENGRYRMMCWVCDALYVPKRRDLYAETQYGHMIGLDK
jgi:hypothetical protein